MCGFVSNFDIPSPSCLALFSELGLSLHSVGIRSDNYKQLLDNCVLPFQHLVCFFLPFPPSISIDRVPAYAAFFQFGFHFVDMGWMFEGSSCASSGPWSDSYFDNHQAGLGLAFDLEGIVGSSRSSQNYLSTKSRLLGLPATRASLR